MGSVKTSMKLPVKFIEGGEIIGNIVGSQGVSNRVILSPVVVVETEGQFCAIALNFDISGLGENVNEALESLFENLDWHIAEQRKFPGKMAYRKSASHWWSLYRKNIHKRIRPAHYTDSLSNLSPTNRTYQTTLSL